MDNRRQYPRIIVLNMDMVFRSAEGETFDVVNASEGGLCLRRQGAPKVAPGKPISGKLVWPSKGVEKDVKGLVCWSRLVDDGDMFYGVHVDVGWLMDQISDEGESRPGDGIP